MDMEIKSEARKKDQGGRSDPAGKRKERRWIAAVKMRYKAGRRAEDPCKMRRMRGRKAGDRGAWRDKSRRGKDES
jgi:hypothetical protein